LETEIDLENAMKNLKARLALLLLTTLCLLTGAYGQVTPSADSYTNTADPTTNFGAKTLLDVDGATQTTYIQFNLSSIPAGASVSQATLKLYINAVTTAGSFNVDYVNGAWSESTITSNLAPALGATIVSSVPITTADKNQYILINITPAVAAWLNESQANDGIALVADGTFNASFDSKENTTTSHPAELDIVFEGGSGGGITGITTASGSGLIGGGTSGTLNLSLTNTCATNQVLQWSGNSWKCASVATGTITGVTAGTDLSGGGTSGNVTLSLNTALTNALYAQLAAANTFTGNQTVSGNLSATGLVTGSAFQIGSNLFAFGSYANGNAFLGFAGNSTTTGFYNTASGYRALAVLGDANQNTATGYEALSMNTTGANNTADGFLSLSSNTTGGANAAFGNYALSANTTGLYNTASGSGALIDNTTGNQNTASGLQSLSTNTTGSNNTAAGFNAGQTADSSKITANNNTALGASSAFGTGAITNATAIGANAEVTESNALVLGSVGGINGALLSSNVGIGTTSPAATLDVHGTGNFTGAVTFASSQTFPGTITAVSAGTDVTVSGTGGRLTVNVDTTKVPQLVATNTFTGNQGVTGSLTATGSANIEGDTRIDYSGLNTGSNSPGIRFGSGGTGEAIASDRAGKVNVNGIDLYTGFTPRLSVTNGGNVGIATTAPAYTLDVRGTGNFSNGVNSTAYTIGANGVYGNSSAVSGTSNGVYGSTASPAGTGVVGVNSATSGSAYGVYAQSESSSQQAVGVYGTTLLGTGVVGQATDGDLPLLSYGVSGYAASPAGVGVAGTGYGASVTGASLVGRPQGPIGVWGDTGYSSGATQDPPAGVLATADNAIGLLAVNNAPGPGAENPADSLAAIVAYNQTTTGGLDFLGLGNDGIACFMDSYQGIMGCTGTMASIVPVDSGNRKVALYSVQAPENWFEDFGSGQLQTGAATIKFDSAYVQTVNSGVEYHVFLTPRGECEGLYISAETADGFEVHELHHGTSSVQFDYRIVAKRKGFENVRMEDKTELFRRGEQLRLRLKGGRASTAPSLTALEDATEQTNRRRQQATRLARANDVSSTVLPTPAASRPAASFPAAPGYSLRPVPQFSPTRALAPMAPLTP
jgi:hypothetical protein